jgi:hypothetical protein
MKGWFPFLPLRTPLGTLVVARTNQVTASNGASMSNANANAWLPDATLGTSLENVRNNSKLPRSDNTLK